MAENGDSEEEPTTYKVLLVGNTGVGKTAFLFRYSKDTFNPSYTATVGIDFAQKRLERKGKKIMLQLWDTAGQERYSSIVTAYFRGGAGFVLMFDLTNQESFTSVNVWVKRIHDHSGTEKPLIILVGNKSDLKESRVVTPDQCKALAQDLGSEYFETSAKDNINIKEIMDYIIDTLEGPPEPSPAPSPEPAPEPKSKSPSKSPEPKYKCYC